MASNGVALAQSARTQAARLRRGLREFHQIIAELAAGEHCGTVAIDADRFDEETGESVRALVQAACAEHPGSRIEVTVIAHQGTDQEDQHGR